MLTINNETLAFEGSNYKEGVQIGKKYKRKAVLLYELILYGIGILLFAALMVIVGSTALNFFRTTVATSEMHQIADQCQNYAGIRKDGKLPPNLEVLLDDTSITATESISGQAYGNFLSKKGRWSAGQVVDPWDTEYSYTANSDGSGTIISSGSGKSLEVDF